MSPLAIVLAALACAGTSAAAAAPVLAAAPTTAPGAPAVAPAPARTVEGRVAYATATTAYLDAGAREGIVPGLEVRLTRGGTPAGLCRVTEVGDHTAACTGQGLRAGERFAVQTAIAPAAIAAQLAALPGEEEQARRLAAVQATPLAMVEAPAKAREVFIPQLPILQGDLGYAVWVASEGGNGYQRLQLDLSVNGLDVVGGFKLFADARFMQWTQKGPAIQGSSTQLLVYDLELAQRDPGRSWTAAVGRVMPRVVPGASVFDGAQAGARIGPAEVGAFGGLIPNAYTTEPSTSSWTGGVYARLEQPIGRTLLIGGARVAAVQDAGIGRHYEGQLTLQYWAGAAVGVSGEIQVGGGDLVAPGHIDFGRLYLTTRPVDPLFIGAGFSYWGLDVPQDLVVTTWPGPSRRGDATVGVDVTRWLTLQAVGGFVDDLYSGLSHQYLSPEALFPKVLDGLMVGYQKDLGWFGGQAAWAQVNWRPGEATQLFGRLSWFQTTDGGNVENDVGLTATGTVGLNRWLALRFSVLVRAGIDGGQASAPFGTASQVFLVGSY